MVTFVEMILLSIDNCFLIGMVVWLLLNHFRTISYRIVFSRCDWYNFPSSTGAERHLKSNGFVTSSEICFSWVVVSSSSWSSESVTCFVEWDGFSFRRFLQDGDLRATSTFLFFLRFFTQYRLVIFFVALAESLLLALIFLSGDGVPGAASRLASYAARQRVSRTCCFFFCYLQLFFCKFCCWPRLSRRGRSEAWICLICPRLPVLGWPSFMVAFFVLTSRRLTCLWRLSISRRVTHDTLVAFVGEAAL